MNEIIEIIENKISHLESEAQEQAQELNNQEECDMCLFAVDKLKEILEEIKLLQSDCKCVTE